REFSHSLGQTRKLALVTAMSAFTDSDQTADIAGGPFRSDSDFDARNDEVRFISISEHRRRVCFARRTREARPCVGRRAADLPGLRRARRESRCRTKLRVKRPLQNRAG